jgi:2-C-methyl-D-erythritol 4-phosphate cytidylyltransferase
MGGPVPKQYLRLGEQTVIEHTLGRLLRHPAVDALVVVLSPDDAWWPRTRFAGRPQVRRAAGGAERADSVRNGLAALEGAEAGDWVLVHDAARPCLRGEDLDRLLRRVEDHPVGGLLGVPVRDTMKRTDGEGNVEGTLPREHLWHAFTPQMFRLGLLREALDRAAAQGRVVTDEAGAVEGLGLRPLMVEGHGDNIKITRPEDLALARFYLLQQEQAHADRPRL